MNPAKKKNKNRRSSTKPTRPKKTRASSKKKPAAKIATTKPKKGKPKKGSEKMAKKKAKKRVVRKKGPVKRKVAKKVMKKKVFKRNPAKKSAPKKPAPKKSASKSERAKKQARGFKSLVKARKSILSSKKKGAPLQKGYMKRHKMKSNPGQMMDAMKNVLPIAATFYGSRFLASRIQGFAPISTQLAKLPMGGKLSGPLASGAVLAAVHFGTQKGALKKQRSGMMLGAAFAVVDSLFSSFAPSNVKGLFGGGEAPVAGYFPQGEYVSQGDYVPQGEYVSQGDYVESLGAYAPSDQEPRELHQVWGVHGDEYGSLTSGW